MFQILPKICVLLCKQREYVLLYPPSHPHPHPPPLYLLDLASECDQGTWDEFEKRSSTEPKKRYKEDMRKGGAFTLGNPRPSTHRPIARDRGARVELWKERKERKEKEKGVRFFLRSITHPSFFQASKQASKHHCQLSSPYCSVHSCQLPTYLSCSKQRPFLLTKFLPTQRLSGNRTFIYLLNWSEEGELLLHRCSCSCSVDRRNDAIEQLASLPI